MLCTYKQDPCVQVKNKPCVEYTIIMRLIPWNHSRGSKTSILYYIFSTVRKNLIPQHRSQCRLGFKFYCFSKFNLHLLLIKGPWKGCLIWKKTEGGGGISCQQVASLLLRTAILIITSCTFTYEKLNKVWICHLSFCLGIPVKSQRAVKERSDRLGRLRRPRTAFEPIRSMGGRESITYFH